MEIPKQMDASEKKIIWTRARTGAIFRSKVRWSEKGERPTKYSFHVENWRNSSQKKWRIKTVER